MSILKYIVLALLLSTLTFSGDDFSNILSVRVDNIRDYGGDIVILLFNQPDGFCKKESKAYKFIEVTTKLDSLTAEFKDIPFGTYAIWAFHDEDSNDKMKKNFIGIPKEGIAISNNAKGFMGPPSFEDASFKFNSYCPQKEITLKYIGK